MHSIEITSTCKAAFQYEPLNTNSDGYGLWVLGSSIIPFGDSILKENWSWGDGAITEGTYPEVNSAIHRYKTSDTINVCLSIQTLKACADTLCVAVSIPLDGIRCFSEINYAVDSNTVKFNSGSSWTSCPDSIISRAWSFGDSTYLNGNIVDPSHTYSDTGYHYVCLTIKTKLGCEHTTCIYVDIHGPRIECAAKFEYNISDHNNNGYPVKFNSNMSEASDADSIIQRIWNWGDGTSQDGNQVDPTHYYHEPGVYEVCLTIKTKLGCEDIYCEHIEIEKHDEITCTAKFEFNKEQYNNDGYGVKFNSNMSETSEGDIIVQRTWDFGDSSIEDGNYIDPLHYYQNNDAYYA